MTHKFGQLAKQATILISVAVDFVSLLFLHVRCSVPSEHCDLICASGPDPGPDPDPGCLTFGEIPSERR